MVSSYFRKLVQELEVRKLGWSLDTADALNVSEKLKQSAIESPGVKLLSEASVTGYSQGFGFATDGLKKVGFDVSSGMTEVDWRALDALGTRNLSLLKGMTADMEKQIMMQVEESMRLGEPWGKLKKRLSNIENMTKNRATLIARTEPRVAFQNAALTRYAQSGVTKVQVLTAWDDRVCLDCAGYSGQIYTLDDAPAIPFHPQCRCVYIPVIEALPGQVYGNDFAHIPTPEEKIASLLKSWAEKKLKNTSQTTLTNPDEMAQVVPKNATVEVTKPGTADPYGERAVIEYTDDAGNTFKQNGILVEEDPFESATVMNPTGYMSWDSFDRNSSINKMKEAMKELNGIEQYNLQQRYEVARMWVDSSEPFNEWLRKGVDYLDDFYANYRPEFVEYAAGTPQELVSLMNEITSTYSLHRDMVLMRGVKNTGVQKLMSSNLYQDAGFQAFSYKGRIAEGFANYEQMTINGEVSIVKNIIVYDAKMGEHALTIGDMAEEGEVIFSSGRTFKITERILVQKEYEYDHMDYVIYHIGEWL